MKSCRNNIFTFVQLRIAFIDQSVNRKSLIARHCHCANIFHPVAKRRCSNALTILTNQRKHSFEYIHIQELQSEHITLV